MVPGRPGHESGSAAQAGRNSRSAWAKYHATGCQVKTDGARIEVAFQASTRASSPASLQYTVYRGTNLLRQEAIAKTNEPSVAYKYVAGLKGFPITDDTRLVWRDTARGWQHYAFGGAVNQDPVGLAGAQPARDSGSERRLAGRVAAVAQILLVARDRDESRLRVLPQGQRELVSRSACGSPIGRSAPSRGALSDEVWNRRVGESRGHLNNFALYNAPPGTMQRMPVYFYLSPTTAGPRSRR